MENRSEATTCLNDFDFGPTVRGCRDDFDFTQFFERTVLWSLPSAVFILAALLRLVYIYRKPKVVLAARLQQVKCVSTATKLTIEYSFLILALTGLHRRLRWPAAEPARRLSPPRRLSHPTMDRRWFLSVLHSRHSNASHLVC